MIQQFDQREHQQREPTLGPQSVNPRTKSNYNNNNNSNNSNVLKAMMMLLPELDSDSLFVLRNEINQRLNN